jgi:hypothetical protein
MVVGKWRDKGEEILIRDGIVKCFSLGPSRLRSCQWKAVNNLVLVLNTKYPLAACWSHEHAPLSCGRKKKEELPESWERQQGTPPLLVPRRPMIRMNVATFNLTCVTTTLVL